MQKLLNNKKILIMLTLIMIVGAFLRLYNLNWDQGHYLHPDERLYVNSSNITFPQSLDEFLSSQSPLNPHMFYYGTFPLYLYKVFQTTLAPSFSFLIASRLLSSLLSIFTIIIVFFIGKELFSKTAGLIAAFLFTFSVGSIQYAHFNTTESLLIFLISTIVLLSVIVAKKEAYLLFIPLGVLTGLSYATKITGLTFIFLPLLSLVILLFKQKKIIKIIIWLIVFLFLTAGFGLLGAPYQLIDYTQFKSQQDYMQGVILGKDKPPFTIIYQGTIPYIYQLTQVLPFIFGFITLPMILAGFFLILKRFSLKKDYLLLFILVYPILYFVWSGSWYAKFERYSLLLLPFLSIWGAFTLQKFKKIPLFITLIFIAINGALFLKVYLEDNTRIVASKWIYENVQNNTTIAGEHWDDNLPLPLSNAKSFNLKQLTVYDPDTPEKNVTLIATLSNSDYFIISSRRVYFSILQNADKYPVTSNFYKQLFSEKLGFQLIKKFTNYPFYFSDDFADETFQSYDHPPVYIFKNVEQFSQNKLQSILKIN